MTVDHVGIDLVEAREVVERVEDRLRALTEEPRRSRMRTHRAWTLGRQARSWPAEGRAGQFSSAGLIPASVVDLRTAAEGHQIDEGRGEEH